MLSALERFVASLRRLLGVGAAAPAERVGEPPADRPPPEPHDLSVPDAAPDLPEPTPAVEAAPLKPAQPDPRAAAAVAEVRALLQAMAEPAAATSEVAGEPAAEVPDAAEAPETVQPALPLEPAPAEAAPPVPAAVDGALVLTLARPAATFTVARTAATIGRGPDNSIRLDDLSVSKKHARIAYRQGGYWLSDLASMGGTWVDGNRLAAPRRIAAGEVIDIGHCRLTVGFAPGEASVEAKKIVGASRRASRP